MWSFFTSSGQQKQATSGGPGLYVIHDETLSVAVTNIDIQNIPQTYKALQLIVYWRSNRASVNRTPLWMQFNNDATASYNYRWDGGGASATQAGAAYGSTGIEIAQGPAATTPTNHWGMTKVLIPNYAGTAAFKTTLSEWGAYIATSDIWHGAGYGDWASTSAINRLKVYEQSGNNLAVGTRVTLLGVN